VSSRPAADTSALVLGGATVITSLATAAVGTADHDAQVTSLNAIGVGVLSVAALGGTVAAFARAVTRTRLRGRAVVGLVLALAAWPIAAGVLAIVAGVLACHQA
jgi:hypothetical protein